MGLILQSSAIALHAQSIKLSTGGPASLHAWQHSWSRIGGLPPGGSEIIPDLLFASALGIRLHAKEQCIPVARVTHPVCRARAINELPITPTVIAPFGQSQVTDPHRVGSWFGEGDTPVVGAGVRVAG